LSSPGDFARTILALVGAGVDPRTFGGHDLVSALAKRRRDNGSFEGWPNSTAFAVIALRAGGAGDASQSTAWLAKVQNGDGGWGDVPGSPSTVDGTGAVLQAIPDTDAAGSGLSYLRKAQRPSGGFPLGGSGGVNSQSTAWAVQGMLAVGTDPASVRAGGKNPLEYLAARQEADGHYRYSDASDQTPIWVTGQVLTAVAGDAFPIAPAPRESQPDSPGLSIAPVPNTGSTNPLPPALGGSEPLNQPGGAVPPSTGSTPPTGGVTPSPKTPPLGSGVAPVPPPVGPEGEEAESAPTEPAASPFEANDNPSPEPWAPIGIGLGTSAVALGSVLFLGRRFSW
ncbi:MAG: prenyltransferase/squalene oxidase repeat-containing protein, partial [Solirubrobacterales bacterium]